MKEFRVRNTVKVFPGPGGWVYVSVPKKYTQMFREMADRGLVPISATVGGTSWKTSLLPMGDGTQFVALNAKVRKAENIAVGDRVAVLVRVRQ